MTSPTTRLSIVALLAPAALAAPGDLLTALDPGAGNQNDRFGESLAVNGPCVVVSAPGEDLPVLGAGAAYAFDTVTGAMLYRLSPDIDPENARFGSGVAISGQTIVVGAAGRDYLGTDSGAVYVFDAATGVQSHELVPDDPQSSSVFGFSVAISGNIIVVGSPYDNIGIVGGTPYFDNGSAYVFDATTGQQLHKLIADDAQSDDLFGWSVSVSGNVALIGAVGDDDRGSTAGAVYLFDVATGAQLSKFIPNAVDDGDQLGRAVAIAGNRAVVGAPSTSTGRGAAYLLDVSDASNPVEVATLTPPTPLSTLDGFGECVAIGGAAVLVAETYADEYEQNAGAAHLFYANSGVHLATIAPPSPEADAQFGLGVAITDNTAVVGSWIQDLYATNSGAAYLFDASAPPCNPADVNADGQLTLDDLDAFIAAYLTSDPLADLTADGVVNLDDLDAFVASYLAGC